MPITADTLRWYQSERMTDEDDGGGQMTGVEIIPGDENQIFDDLSDVDRAAGDVSLRKVYAAVASGDDDKYLDAGVVVFRAPADPDVSVTIFSTGSYYDERLALQTSMESQVVKGGIYPGYLWGDHIVGLRAVTFWARLSTKVPVAGDRFALENRVNGALSGSQFVWVTRVTEQVVDRVDQQRGQYQVRLITCEIAEPLRYEFKGLEPTYHDPTTVSTNGTLTFETRYNPDSVAITGIAPLAVAAEVGDYTVQVDSIYSPLIPTAFAETAIPDANPGGGAAALVSAGDDDATITWTTTLDAIKPGASLFAGGPVLPGTLSITVSGSAITDQGGVLLMSGTDIGAIDYGNGVMVWNSACPAFSTALKTITYTPAAQPLRVADTARLWVTLENRGFVWVLTLAPIPARKSLRVSYRANNEWYTLIERGDGILKGADSSYGSGTLVYETGTVTITTGALPDPDSEILFAWGTNIAYTARGGSAVDPLVVRGKTAHPQVAPSTVSVTWSGGSLTDDGAGVLTGTGGTGTIEYASGEWTVTPTTVPAKGTEFTLEYDYGPALIELFSQNELVPDGFGNLNLMLDNPVQPRSLKVSFTVGRPASASISAVSVSRKGEDNGSGAVIIPLGNNGTVNYATGEVTFNPTTTEDVVVPVFGLVEV
jgi:hypothetical protein